METLVMTAKDDRFTTGKIGLGSFDDTGSFDNLRVWLPLPPSPEPKSRSRR
jgi:hypothetical protein